MIRHIERDLSDPQVRRFANAPSVDDAIGGRALFTLAADDAGAEQFVGQQLSVGSNGDNVGEGPADVDGKLPVTLGIQNELRITSYQLRVVKSRSQARSSS